MKKKGFIAALIMTLVLACTWAQEPNSEDDFDWKVNDDFTEITITNYKGTRKDVVIPASIQDVPVVCIGGTAFRYAPISSIVIPDSVKTIEDGDSDRADYSVFANSYLTSVTFPKGIYIGKNAFYYCSRLTSIVIPDGAVLGEGAFADCENLEVVTLEEGVKRIPEGCFKNCKKLSQVNFPSSLRYIDDMAFYRCALTSVDLPEGVAFLRGSPFYCNTITSVSLPKSLKWLDIVIRTPVKGGYTCLVYGADISSITIAEGCTPKILISEKRMKSSSPYIVPDFLIDESLGDYNRKSKKDVDGRELVASPTIRKTIKLMKQLADWKLQTCHTSHEVRDSGKIDFKVSGWGDYAFVEDGKELYADLLSYGFSEEEAKSICAQFTDE